MDRITIKRNVSRAVMVQHKGSKEEIINEMLMEMALRLLALKLIEVEYTTGVKSSEEWGLQEEVVISMNAIVANREKHREAIGLLHMIRSVLSENYKGMADNLHDIIKIVNKTNGTTS